MERNHSLKRHIVNCIHHFSSMPDFIIPNPSMNVELIESFYTTLIELVTTYGYEFEDASQMKYLKSNLPDFTGSTKSDLINYLNSELTNHRYTQSRYYLGMRMVYVILDRNIDLISIDYLAGINKMLEPFYRLYAHKELFIPGLEFISTKEVRFS